MTWTVSVIPAENLKGVWPIASPLLAPAIDRSGGRIDQQSTYRWIEDGRLLLWFAANADHQVRAAFTTRIAHYPLKSMLVVECLGGSDMHLWVDVANEAFKGYARRAGCEGVEMYGRRGFARALRKFGWKETMVLCEIDASDGA